MPTGPRATAFARFAGLFWRFGSFLGRLVLLGSRAHSVHWSYPSFIEDQIPKVNTMLIWQDA